MGNLITQILTPNVFDSFKQDKPLALIVIQSSHDKTGSADSFNEAVDTLRKRGYGILNKSCLIFDLSGNFEKAIKPGSEKKETLTIWLQSDGAPGCLFGSADSATTEFVNSMDFTLFVHLIEEITSLAVSNIVLCSKFSATEMFNLEQQTYFNSSARVLSLLLPDKNIMGFIGEYRAGKVINVFRLEDDGSFKPATVNPEEAAVVYKNGDELESHSSTLFCNHTHTPHFIFEQCNFHVEIHARETTFYKPCSARKKMENELDTIPEHCYGEQQLVAAMSFSPHIEETLEDTMENVPRF